ncbi:MAG TPA: hypothetical protein VMZ06_00555 [Candidatus Bathyarchaeia archaeon]|nr:hypothetical protein [Candidatus Bathyarchaeia archaeon]
MSDTPAACVACGGLAGLVQRALQLINRAGWRLFERRWPLVIVHISVFKKM